MNFIDICEFSKSLSNRIAVCAEEIMTDIINKKGKQIRHAKHFFDIRLMEIMDDEGKQSRGIQIFVKSRGKSDNLIRKDAFSPESLLTGCDLGLLLINRLCDDIDYNYRNGVNCVVLKFYK